MATTTRQQLRTLNLSARQLKDMSRNSGAEWSDEIVNEWLNNLQNSIIVANSSDENIDSIEQNSIDIDTNSVDINTNAVNFENHDTSTMEHGVTGNNVGDEDFCTQLVGGVVLLMELVNDAILSNEIITSPNVLTAPAAYNQAYIQTIANLANGCKSRHNSLVEDFNNAVTQINDLIAKSKTAKQMDV